MNIIEFIKIQSSGFTLFAEKFGTIKAGEVKFHMGHVNYNHWLISMETQVNFVLMINNYYAGL